MPEEQKPTTGAPAAEAAQPATPAPEAPKAETPPTAAELKWKAEADLAWRAYKGLQTNVNRLHTTNEERDRKLSKANEELAGLRETLNAVAARNLSPEELKSLDDRQKVGMERAAALQAAQSLEQSVQATIGLTDRLMASAGLSDADRQAVYLAARNTSGIQEWTETVHALATQRIEQVFAQRIAKETEGLKGKALAEAKAEAEALLARQIKESGIDKVDTGTGGTASTKKSLAEMNDAEFAVYSEQQAQQRRERLMRRMSGSSR